MTDELIKQMFEFAKPFGIAGMVVAIQFYKEIKKLDKQTEVLGEVVKQLTVLNERIGHLGSHQ